MSLSVGTRICVSPTTSGAAPSLGTVLYVGPVPPTSGTWLGVEWDDASRGKHDGVHDKTGLRYFQTRVPGAGSFIRPTLAGLSTGSSFRDALLAKYDPPDEHDDDVKDETAFFATDSNFEVEVPSLEKLRKRFKAVDRLREVGLEYEGVNGHSGVALDLPALEVLNLSFNLLPTVEAVDSIICQCNKLDTLALNSNRLRPPEAPLHDLKGFADLRTIQLNNTLLLSWRDIVLLSPSLPSLEHLQFGANRIERLASDHKDSSAFPSLKTLNLDSNLLSSWRDIVTTLSPLPKLERLILSSNQIASLSLPSTVAAKQPLASLRHLHLTQNRLASWTEISALSIQLPDLAGLWIGENLLTSTFGISDAAVRIGTISRIASLTELDGSQITAVEREDAELFYLSSIAREADSDDQKAARHPRWTELRQKYAEPAKPVASQSNAVDNKFAAKRGPNARTIKSNLIRLHLSLRPLISSTPASSSPLEPTDVKSHTLALLPTSSTRLLRTHFARLFKDDPEAKGGFKRKSWRLVAVLIPSPACDEAEDGKEGGHQAVTGMRRKKEAEEENRGGLRVLIPEQDEGKDLGYWGLQDGDGVLLEQIC